jgi:hypothetical protein
MTVPDSPSPSEAATSSEGLEATSPGFRPPTRRRAPSSSVTPPQTTDQSPPSSSPSPPTTDRRRRLAERVRERVGPPRELGEASPSTSSRASSGDVRALTNLGAMVVIVGTRAAAVFLRGRLGGRELAATRTEARAVARPVARFVGRRVEMVGDVRNAADVTEVLFAIGHYLERVAGWEVSDADLEQGQADLEALHPDAPKPRARRGTRSAPGPSLETDPEAGP